MIPSAAIAAIATPCARFRLLRALIALIALPALLSACAGGAARSAPDVVLSAASGWTDLNAADAWRGYRRNDLPDGWRFDTLTRELTVLGRGGDIITRAQFTDFELELEWKVGARGNSGVFFRANEGTRRIYENAAEMQILDNAGHFDGRNALTAAGSNYALHAPVRDVTRPLGQWNTIRIVARGAHVEHWLNGVKVVDYEMWSDDWTARVAAAKFAAWPTYGLARRGHVGLQDHGDVVSFRRMRIREIAR
jgi:hypothetical protein